MTLRSRELQDIVGILAAEFPEAFVVERYQQHRALKVGIDADLAARYTALSRTERGVILRLYTSRLQYLKACTTGAPRIDLDGAVVGAVSASEAAHAASRLATILESRIAKRLAAEAAKKAECEAARKKAAVAQPISPLQPANSAPSPVIKRPVLSLPCFKKRAAQ
jgi:sRNA-binding protein